MTVILDTVPETRLDSASDLARASHRRGAVRRPRWEPWRDWVIITLLNHAILLTIALLHVRGMELALSAVPLAMGFAVGTLTVLHDAGHRMFGRRSLPNVFAVQTSTPLGLWVGHWGRKHRVHHKWSQVYPHDEATRSSGMVRLHPGAPRRPAHRWQHLYIWPLYGLTWLGELRSQLTFLRTGVVAGGRSVGRRQRSVSFVAEKLLCALVLLPYALLLGVGRLALLMLLAMTLASVLVALVLVVGHINMDLQPSTRAPEAGWTAYLMRTTASFSTSNRVTRWLTGGMTHHHVHHLRPLALRSDFPALHRALVQDVAATTGVGVAEFPTFTSALTGHARRLRELGRPDPMLVHGGRNITVPASTR